MGTETPPGITIPEITDAEPDTLDFVSWRTYAVATQLIYDDLDSEAGYNIFLIHIALAFTNRTIYS